ncbi:MAG TPA: tetratricopeptide repeat protein [Proteiniphilum sp.]|nr:tetratricopeptide repeat protein [Proteiniphilum sp.]HPJ49739.1 tetratricopeptide repeat protein [Proteiniphilum sp.]
MRKILFLTMMAVLTSGSIFAQKSALKDAKRALGRDDLNEARTMIKQAAEHPETATDPETWKIWGDIGNKAFDLQRTNAMLGKSANDKVMYDGLMESYVPYVKADSLAELPDAKGRVKNKVRKDIAGILRANHPFYINGGVYYNDQGDYKTATDFFEVYWNIPGLPMFEGENDAFVLDSTFQTIKYYAIITAIQGEDHKRALAMLQRAAKEPFIENSAYKESDIYELMASEYIQLGDSAKFLEILYDGAEKFPSSNYFLPNLVNVFIREGNTEKAMQYLDKAIENTPQNSCDLNSVKGALLAEQGNYDAAEAEYRKALAQDPNCERALEAIAVNFILQAQDLKEKTALMSDRQQQMENDKKTVELYQKALPSLEKYAELLKGREAPAHDIESALLKLRNVYYNLSSMGVDKSKEMEEVEKELNL